MIEKSNVENKDSKNQITSNKNSDLSQNIPVKRGRGRPKGSKNKPKQPLDPPKDKSVGKKRGPGKKRSKTLKDERSSVKPGKRVKLSLRSSSKRAKPCIPAKTEEEVLHDQLMEHPLFVAAKWLENKMHPSEMQYYRRTANQKHTSVLHAMVSDMLGLFNNQDHDFCKLVKKNKFVVNNTLLNEIHQ